METKTCLRKGSGAPIQRMHGGGISPRQFGELSLKFAGFTGISTGYEDRPKTPSPGVISPHFQEKEDIPLSFYCDRDSYLPFIK